MKRLVSFDRVIAVVALIVGFSGGLPTLIQFFENKNYFEIMPVQVSEISFSGSVIDIKLEVDILNSGAGTVTIFGLGYAVETKSAEGVYEGSVNYWNNVEEDQVALPAKLETGDSSKFFLWVPYDMAQMDFLVEELNNSIYSEKKLEAHEIESRLRSIENNQGDIGLDGVRQILFPDYPSLFIQDRAACDDIGMSNGILSRCVKLNAAIEKRKVAGIGEFSISFFPSMEK